MPDYADILNFLAKNPPKLDAERRVHASLLELLGACLRGGDCGTHLIEGEVAPQADGAVSQSQIH